MPIAEKLDTYGKPAWIALIILGFWVWVPAGLAILAFSIWSGRMGCWSRHRHQEWQDRMEQKWAHKREKWARHGFGGGFGGWGGPPTSGNRAFDDYRMETLRRLEEEQREFHDFLERLRFARDKNEFDQFMAERRNRPTPTEQPAPQA